MSAAWRERIAQAMASIGTSQDPSNVEVEGSRFPKSASNARSGGLEEQARAVLRIFLETALAIEAPAPIAADPRTCPNCGERVESQRSPYCGNQCREESAFVRQLRGAVEKGVIDDERHAAMGQVLWHLLGGGYPGRVSLVPDKVRQKLFARNGGKCELCDSPATTVDHIKTACNRPINLRAVCDPCSCTVPYGDPNFMASAKVQSILQRLSERVAAETPLRCCDDPVAWDWREFLAMRNRTS